jgi:hypothetical protein
VRAQEDRKLVSMSIARSIEEAQCYPNVCGFHIVVLILLYDKGVSIPSNTILFDFILFSTPATCFGLLSGHHQALGYTTQLYIYLLLLLTAIHYYCLYISVVTVTPCTVVFRVFVSSHMCVLWFLFPVWGCIQLVSEEF